MAIDNVLARITTIRSRINQIKQRINSLHKSDFDSVLKQEIQKNDNSNSAKNNAASSKKNLPPARNTGLNTSQQMKIPKMTFEKNAAIINDQQGNFSGPASIQLNPLSGAQRTEQFNQQISKLSDEIGSIILDKSHQHEVDPLLISAIMAVESDFNPSAVSNSGAMGLMQLMPGTANELGVHNPFNMTQNIDGGVKYFKMLLERFSGDLKLALAAYNAGPNAVAKYGGVPPYEETQNYVVKVLGNYEKLLKQKQQINNRNADFENPSAAPANSAAADINSADAHSKLEQGKVEIIKNMRETSEAILESSADENSDDNNEGADLF